MSLLAPSSTPTSWFYSHFPLLLPLPRSLALKHTCITLLLSLWSMSNVCLNFFTCSLASDPPNDGAIEKTTYMAPFHFPYISDEKVEWNWRKWLYRLLLGKGYMHATGDTEIDYCLEEGTCMLRAHLHLIPVYMLFKT